MKERILSSRFVRRISSWKVSRFLSGHRIFGKFFNYEFISYVIAGVLTTVVNYVVYFLMPRFESNGLDIVLANTVSWIAAVLFAYVVNKIFVFDSPSWAFKTVIRELLPFIGCRLLSWGFDTLFMYVTVGLLHWNEPLFKIISNVFVLLMNYFASKFLIFKHSDAGSRKEPRQEDEHETEEV